MVVFFSIPFLVVLLALLVLPSSVAPTFSALGAYFLRSGSMLTDVKTAAVVGGASLASLALLSLALVAINLVVKAARTRTRVSAEHLRHLGRYTIIVFCLFLSVKIVEFALLWVLIERGMSELLVFIVSFLLSLGLFYVAPAVVLEEKKPIPAMISSYQHIARKPLQFLCWMALGLVLLTGTMWISYSLLDALALSRMAMQLIVILITSLFVLPFLTIMQAQMYLLKYTIIK
jgi:hypothetical protein